MAILNNTSQTDTLYTGCSAMLYSRVFGIDAHTNCNEIQAEAQREYGLQPYHIHPSFNIFMYVEMRENGQPMVVRNKASKHNYIEFVALMDVLAIPNVCGDDLTKCSNFWLAPLKAVVMEPTSEEAGLADQLAMKADQKATLAIRDVPSVPLTRRIVCGVFPVPAIKRTYDNSPA